MAIAEMKKLNLAAMSYDRDKLLNALQRTGATEVKTHYEVENTSVLYTDTEKLQEYCNRLENALNLLCAEIDGYNKENKIKSEDLKDGFIVSLREFRGAGSLKDECDEIVEKVNALFDERRAVAAERAKISRTLETAEIYAPVKDKFSCFSSTAHVTVRLGVIPSTLADAFKAEGENGLCATEILNISNGFALALFAVHKSEEGESVAQNYGFTDCPFPPNKSGEELNRELSRKLSELKEKGDRITKAILSFSKHVKTLKIYGDYLGFELEKLSLSEKMRATETTFLLEAYLPADSEERVKEAIDETSGAVYYEFCEPAEDEIPPTLYRNNKVVENFETITDMYSPPSSKEFDPNGIMAVFYSVFLGFIMGDIGYGLLMFLGGGAIYLKKREDTGSFKKLAGVFAVGGIFAIVWGLLFGALFGIEIFRSVMPNPQNDRWHFMGIAVPSVLVISLEIGVVHLFAGYICRAVQCIRRGKVWDAVLDGLVWAVFSIGIFFVIIGFIDEANISALSLAGGIIAGASLLVAILTAGRKEKLLGKFTKGFGAAYGIINYVSDILSYARLYGLMLSGAVIAQIISQYSLQFFASGNVALILLAVVLMLVGHAFNLAIGLLGAYIHDARLQYVEFYGRFFEGEGELFKPLGSNGKYVKIVEN